MQDSDRGRTATCREAALRVGGGRFFPDDQRSKVGWLGFESPAAEAGHRCRHQADARSSGHNGDVIRLTSFSHGGGCGCKVAPGVLSEILQQAGGVVPEALLVGLETSDDAAVYRINAEQALIATTDFFMPIVDDPFDFGRIAATNAISDVYAMGGTPILALALVAMPIDKLPLDVIRRVIEGGESVCTAARIPIAGGHTIDSVEPIYGLVAMGLVHPDRLMTNRDARPGDVLVLGKPIGVGIYSAALKKEQLDAGGYRELIGSTTRLNTPGPHLSAMSGVHALTDVTGFGLLGHLLEMCRGSKLRAEVRWPSVPLLPGVAGRGHESRPRCLTPRTRTDRQAEA